MGGSVTLGPWSRLMFMFAAGWPVGLPRLAWFGLVWPGLAAGWCWLLAVGLLACLPAFLPAFLPACPPAWPG